MRERDIERGRDKRQRRREEEKETERQKDETETEKGRNRVRDLQTYFFCFYFYGFISMVYMTPRLWSGHSKRGFQMKLSIYAKSSRQFAIKAQ